MHCSTPFYIRDLSFGTCRVLEQVPHRYQGNVVIKFEESQKLHVGKKLCVDFQLPRGWALLTPALFMGSIILCKNGENLRNLQSYS